MKLERNLIFAFLLVAAALPLVVGDQYLLHIGIMVMFYAVLATSLNLVVGYVGEFSLGHTAFLGIGAYTAAICSLKLGLPRQNIPSLPANHCTPATARIPFSDGFHGGLVWQRVAWLAESRGAEMVVHLAWQME
jgi:ABC-type branched-subunit amino acid transport system permease subunit